MKNQGWLSVNERERDGVGYQQTKSVKKFESFLSTVPYAVCYKYCYWLWIVLEILAN